MSGGAEAVVQYLREEERSAKRRQREGLLLASLITCATGVGLTIFLWLVVPARPAYSAGLIPILVGVALALAYSFSPKNGREQRS